jgi:hypothetical protein
MIIDTTTFRFFSHVEVDGLESLPVEDSDVLRLPARQNLQVLEQLREEFLRRWEAGEAIDDVVQQVFALPVRFFLPAQSAFYVVGYNVHSPQQLRLFRQVMNDLDRYIAALSQFALRVRVLSVTQPLPQHPDGYPDLSSVLRTIRYLGEGLWLRAVNDFERQRRQCLSGHHVPNTLTSEGAVPEQMADALELLLYKAQIVRILASDPVGEVEAALDAGADEYVHALHRLIQAVLCRWYQRRFRKLALLPRSGVCRITTKRKPRA